MKQMWSKEEIDKEVKNTYKDISTLVDASGNPRFVEGDGVGLSQEGVTISYCKWSLSGTHLMLVCAGTIANTTVIAANSKLAKFTLPDYIKNKIYSVWQNNIEAKEIKLYADDWSNQTLQIKFQKITEGLQLETASLTLTADRSFRIQYDLLIDVE